MAINLTTLVNNQDVLKKLTTKGAIKAEAKKYKAQYAELEKKAADTKNELKNKIKKSKKLDVKLKKEKVKKILGNVTKSLIPLLTMYLTDKLSKGIGNNSEMEELVDSTNAIIDAATTLEEINNSKVQRDRALTILNNQQENIQNIQDYIESIQRFSTIFGLIIRVLTLLTTPTAVPPGIGVPMAVIMKLVQKLQDAILIVDSVSVVLSIVSPILQRIIDNYEELKNSLHNLNEFFENKSLETLDPNEFSSYIDEIRNKVNTNLGEYKGYKFVLKQEYNEKYVVSGNIRH